MYTGVQGLGEDRENILREFLFIVFERKRLVLLVSLPVMAFCIILALVLPSSYRSTAKFSLLVPQQLDPLRQDRSIDYGNRARRHLQEQKELILSNSVLRRVVEGTYPDIGPERAAKQIEGMREHVEVTPPPAQTFEETSVFCVSYTGNNPNQVYDITKRIVDSYVHDFNELSKVRTAYSVDFLQDQTDRLYKEVMEKEKNLRDYETKEAVALVEIVGLSGGQTTPEFGPNALLTQFKRRYHELQQELAGLKVAVDGLEGEMKKDTIPAVLPEMDQAGRAIQIYKNKLAQLQIAMNEMRSQFTGEFLPLKQAEKELKLDVSSMKEELGRTIMAQKLNAQSIEAKLKDLEGVIDRLEEHISSTAQERSIYEHKKEEYRLAKETYVAARTQMEQARVANALVNSKWQLTQMEEPTLPIRPVKPNRLAIMTLGLLAGAFLGIATAVTVDYFDHTIKKTRDIEKFMNVPALGSIPRIG